MILNINGKNYEVQENAQTILQVLHEDVGLGGTKEGCGVGVCGACTILVDGNPISGCLTLVEQVVGKQILTVEGLEKDGELHPVQQAFIDERAFQCAYCTPGFILTTVALINENPDPSDDEIREYLSGNLCRCGSYQNILSAVKRASRNSPNISSNQNVELSHPSSL